MVTSDFRPEVEIRPFRACAMHPAIILEQFVHYGRGGYGGNTTFHRTHFSVNSCCLSKITKRYYIYVLCNKKKSLRDAISTAFC